MADEDNAKLVARAEALEKRQNFVKAADTYMQAGMKEKAAEVYEKGCDYSKAAGVYEELGRSEDAERCREKHKKANSYGTWEDEQKNFQQEFGNPY
jgi:hypothetical protein